MHSGGGRTSPSVFSTAESQIDVSPTRVYDLSRSRSFSASPKLTRFLTALLLANALLICPTLCRMESGCGCCAVGSVSNRSDHACPHGCCSKSDKLAEDGSPVPRSPRNPSPNSCICKGALAHGKSFDFELQDLGGWIAESAPIASVHPQLTRQPDARSAIDARLSGPDLRIACCSWLC